MHVFTNSALFFFFFSFLRTNKMCIVIFITVVWHSIELVSVIGHVRSDLLSRHPDTIFFLFPFCKRHVAHRACNAARWIPCRRRPEFVLVLFVSGVLRQWSARERRAAKIERQELWPIGGIGCYTCFQKKMIDLSFFFVKTVFFFFVLQAWSFACTYRVVVQV